MAKFYQVGGSVRDKILGVQSKDIDYAVECASFDAMRQSIIARGGKIFLETPQYFTIRAHVPTLGATDYVLCRKDGDYKDGRRPESVTVGTIFDDLSRRDFTMNAIAIDTDTGEVLDPHHGAWDIENRIIRAVGDARLRLLEDRLRAFRAARFAITKGFTIEDSLKKSIQAIVDFDGVSTERMREEVGRMFKHDTRESIYYLFDKFDNLGKVILSRGIWFEPTTKKV